MNVLKFRLFFTLCLDDGDFASVDGNAFGEGLFRPMDNLPPHLMVSSAVTFSLELVRFAAD